MSKSLPHINNNISIAPLVTFRIAFGLIMMISIIRFVWNGWVYDQYIEPQFYFSYYGFEWIKPLPPTVVYLLFGIMGIAAFMIMIGAYYRVFTLLFFLSFTYVELIDKTNYLNHYYFVSLVSFLLIWVPANRKFSIDILRKPNLKLEVVPAWTINIFKLQLAIVYFYAGVAKINSDWLFKALPLKIWLPANSHLPIIGNIMKANWVAYAFSWFGAIYDLSIPVFLILKKTRPYAYAAVIFFHLMTWLLFPIGMFPFIMILVTLIFFSAKFHEQLISVLSRFIRSLGLHRQPTNNPPIGTLKTSNFKMGLMAIFVIIQLLLPWRYLLYPGNLFWTEEGYRFSWRVMLMEKAGYTIFTIKDPATGRTGQAYANDYLTPNQEKMMATQPDMILQFSHFLADKYKAQGVANPIITVDAFATLNGTGSKLLIDNQVDLTKITEGFKSKTWILPFDRKDKITSKQ